MINFDIATNEEIKQYFSENFKLKSNTIDLFKEIAQLRGGKCLSNVYINNTTPLNFVCIKNHNFFSQSKTIKRGSWCLICSNQKTNNKRVTDNEENFLERINKLNFKLVGNLNSTKKESTFECEKGHQFNVIGRYLYRDNYLCPICTKNTGRFKSEHIIRLYLEAAFNKKFIKCNPDWLKMPDSGRILELDGYCEDLKLAYEYQGEQHNNPTAFYQNRLDKFERRVELDQRKKELCKQNGIVLIEIKEIPKRDNSFDNIYHHLQTTFKNYGLILPFIKEGSIDLDNIYQKDYYAELVEVANSKGGSVESESYLGSSTKIKFKCKKGHIFESAPNKVKLGSWCPYCTNQKGKTLDKVIKKAHENQGKCLSKNYVSAEYKYEFKCKNETHPIFYSSEKTILKGSWCPYCSGNFDFTLTKYNDLVKDKNGLLIQGRINDETKPLKWQCFHKHQFKLTIDEVESGKWCNQCNQLNGENL